MKASLTTIISMIFFAQLGLAQVKLNENFEDDNFPPPGWTTMHINGASHWAQGHEQFFSGYGTAFIGSDSTGSEEWLVTPQLQHISNTDTLFFFFKKRSGVLVGMDSLLLRISESGNDTTAAFTYTAARIHVTAIPTGYWLGAKIPLGAFAGKDIYIAFAHKELNGPGVYIDSVSVTSPYNTDIAILPMADRALFVASKGSPVTMLATVVNKGLSNVPFTITRTILPGAYKQSKTVTSLAYNQSYQVFFPAFTDYEPGTSYIITDSVSVQNDAVADNNTSMATLTLKLPRPTLVYYFDDPSRDSLVAHFESSGMHDKYDLLDWYSLPSFSLWSNLVILCPDANTFANYIKDSVKSYLDNARAADKKALFLFGNDLGHIYDRPASPYKDTTFFRQYLKAKYVNDNWVEDLPGAGSRIRGKGTFIKVLTDQVVDPYPDGISPCNGSESVLVPDYKGAGGDTAAAVYYRGKKYNVFVGTNLYAAYRNKGKEIISYMNEVLKMDVSLLPTELTSFQAETVKKDVYLKWVTASEYNTNGISVERSTDGTSFNKIAFIDAQAASATGQLPYQYLDESPFTKYAASALYYRLSYTNNEGTTSYSSSRLVKEIKDPLTGVVSVPNPFAASMELSFNCNSNTLVQATLVNIKGELVSNRAIDAKEGFNKVAFDNLDGLPEGMYVLILNVEGASRHFPLIKIR